MPQDLIVVPVSAGELIDKITILELKSKKIADPEKARNIQTELSSLREVWTKSQLSFPQDLKERLFEVNSRLWDVEDLLREKERQKEFDAKFIELARAVYYLNDERFSFKSKINAATGSQIREEKSYKPY